MTGKSKNRQDQTESCRLMRGAWNTYYEYIPELYTEPILFIIRNNKISVGCDVVVHVIRTGVLLDTRRGRQCKLFANKGGNTGFILVLFGTGIFLLPDLPLCYEYQKGELK